MESTKSSKQRLIDAEQLERSGELEAAIAAYRKITDADPINPGAVARLLVLYRKQKQFRDELAIVNRALAGYRDRDKSRQKEWVRNHTKAAAAGTAVFQKLGGASVSGFGTNPFVVTLLRRKENLEWKISGKKGTKRVRKSRQQPSPEVRNSTNTGGSKNKKAVAASDQRKERVKPLRAERKKRETRRKKTAFEQRTGENRKRQQQAAAQRKRQAANAKKRVEAAKRKREIGERKAAASKVEQQQKKATRDAALKAAEEKKQPSLFVITLIYGAPRAEVDAEADAHIAFLNKHTKRGDFLFSGRQIPPAGETILAKAKDHRSVERIMKADPLVRLGLAELQVVEFKVRRLASGVSQFLAKRGK